MQKTPYHILGVEATASKTVVEAAYKRLRSAHHPDRGGDPSKFKQVIEAYDKIKASRITPPISLNTTIPLSLAIAGGSYYLMIAANQSPVLVNIPPKINQGQVLVFKELIGGRDVRARFQIIGDDVWGVEYLTVSRCYPVDVFVLIVGGKLQVDTPQGDRLDLVIPPRTQSGSKFRIPQRGICDTKNAAHCGDMIVVVELTIPEVIPAELERVIRDYANSH